MDFTKISFQITDEKSFRQILYILLKSLHCPFLIDLPQESGIFLEDSRDLLIILAWIIQISGLFDRYHEKFLEKVAEDLDFKEDFFEKSDISSVNISNSSKNIDENEIIEAFTIFQKKFEHLFALFHYKSKTTEKLLSEISHQKLNMKLNELFLLKNDQKFNKILDRLSQINSALEREKGLLKHEELFWLWMESVIDLDKKEIMNESSYGFSDSKDSLQMIPKEDYKGIEHLFNELKLLNEKHQKHKEKFEEFQRLWEKRKGLLNSEKKNMLKNESLKLLTEFERKFISFEKMQGMIQKNISEVFFVSEILTMFPQNEKKYQEVYDKEEELEKALKRFIEEEKEVKQELKEKIQGLFGVLKEKFVIYPELK